MKSEKIIIIIIVMVIVMTIIMNEYYNDYHNNYYNDKYNEYYNDYHNNWGGGPTPFFPKTHRNLDLGMGKTGKNGEKSI